MAEEKRKKTYVADMERGVYDVRDSFSYDYKTDSGLTPDIVREISAKKDEPQWMLDFRLRSLAIYQQMDVPPWAPDISGLNMEEIVTYVRPRTDMTCRRILRKHLIVWVFRVRSKLRLPVLGRNMTLRWCTTISRKIW